MPEGAVVILLNSGGKKENIMDQCVQTQPIYHGESS